MFKVNNKDIVLVSLLLTLHSIFILICTGKCRLGELYKQYFHKKELWGELKKISSTVKVQTCYTGNAKRIISL